MSHELAVSFTQLGFWSIIGVVLYIQYLCNHAQSIMLDAERVHRASIIRSPRPNDPFAFAKLDGGRRFLAVLHAGARWEGKCIEPNDEADSFARAADHHARTLRAIADGDPAAASRECRELLNLLELLARQAIETRGTNTEVRGTK